MPEMVQTCTLQLQVQLTQNFDAAVPSILSTSTRLALQLYWNPKLKTILLAHRQGQYSSDRLTLRCVRVTTGYHSGRIFDPPADEKSQDASLHTQEPSTDKTLYYVHTVPSIKKTDVLVHDGCSSLMIRATLETFVLFTTVEMRRRRCLYYDYIFKRTVQHTRLARALTSEGRSCQCAVVMVRVPLVRKAFSAHRSSHPCRYWVKCQRYHLSRRRTNSTIEFKP
ncbi:hypothetical protein BXZ70DRAFT_90220 [Cristinia sonorae]|uniref:Uncharacterized protein n=1 Tax=Cristinia sonorae TaxID=1940300 RepID=A0A8K0UQW3_9AGAR|nr:hypothetical protein BXZ70DRAFT_90220 [Cristinia sonorae]